MGFLEYCTKHADKILSKIADVSQCYPESINAPDNRFGISRQMLNRLHGKKLKKAESKGYDMVFREDNKKISVKIMKSAFQRPRVNKPNQLIAAQKIILKNCLGNNIESEFDWLLVIQRGENKAGVAQILGFAVISKEKLNSIGYNKVRDQVIIKIKNSEYDFFTGFKDNGIVDNPEYFSALEQHEQELADEIEKRRLEFAARERKKYLLKE